ncbi:DUF3572 domain-containing protein [Lutibaculum baratangense]|uniref:DUF3572 domain-containing protein n=1 Tax=Lutibaculum baratangense AMV1 TaxID=631454 RepID=V4RK07_9HYPH|nr:DUF3572 domain-containing protein [Lutibaculum baratangense]ESR23590.1 hypothetical protein N177_3658 [Lutibaculum baratangense AMV1]
MKTYRKANSIADSQGSGPDREAEEIGLLAFAFLARDQERILRFLRLTGIEPEAIREVAGEPGFLRAVLDHVMADEALLLVFCEEERIDPIRLPVLRQRLAARGGGA